MSWEAGAVRDKHTENDDVEKKNCSIDTFCPSQHESKSLVVPFLQHHSLLINYTVAVDVMIGVLRQPLILTMTCGLNYVLYPNP